jgi:hypothetical protein
MVNEIKMENKRFKKTTDKCPCKGKMATAKRMDKCPRKGDTDKGKTKLAVKDV